jgi:uncharacterized protein (DUF1015 family)
MATIKPFAALRPTPDLAPRICALPYDVLSSDEARAMAAGNPLSFLHVSKPEIDLPPGTDPCSEAVYAKGRENFHRLIAERALRPDHKPCFYLYRQTMDRHHQLGLVAVASCQEYLTGVIKKHELTRVDKEDDRVRHIEALNAQTGPAFLVYRANPELDRRLDRIAAGPPAVDFTANDGIRHASWVVEDADEIAFIARQFAEIPCLYIADGHHRTAAAARVFDQRRGDGPASSFLAVIFPHDQLRILPYNRVVRDLNGQTPEKLLLALARVFVIDEPGSSEPRRQHEMGFYLGGRWRTLRFRPEVAGTTSPVEQLDVTLLQRHVLAPLFGIEDPRTCERISFVGGVRGTGELERLVDRGEFACAFSLFPISIEDLMVIADGGGILPPKSTWFEPKLRDAMFCHRLESAGGG